MPFDHGTVRVTGTHRIAGTALLRALLQSSNALPLSTTRKDLIQNVIRNRFRRNRSLTSTRLVGIGFKAGYQALALFHHAISGDEASLRRVRFLLDRAPNVFKQPFCPKEPIRETTQQLKIDQCDEHRGQPREISQGSSIFTRPHLNIAGRRRVPRLAVTCNIPFLRVKKPQPLSLSISLSRRIVRDQKLRDLRDQLEVLSVTAGDEDYWDRLTNHLLQSDRSSNNDEVRWEKGVLETLQATEELISKRRSFYEKNMRMMKDIVSREAALAKQEKQERLMQRLHSKTR